MSENKPHIIPLKVYLSVAFALIFLTGITVAVSFVDFGGLNVIIALLIASVKALLVAFFFMHLFYDNKLYFVIFAASLFFLTLFLVLTMFDTNRRGDIYKDVAKPISEQTNNYIK